VDSGLYAACAGLRAQSQASKVAAHNLANLNTSGFSPTIGIIGAVLGLIQVMQHLDKIDEVEKRHCRRLCRDTVRGGRRQPPSCFRPLEN